MAKHPHRLLLQQKKTWRCMLPGCSFFVHMGLAHVLIGKTAICWECREEFTINDVSLREDTPRCNTCRGVVVPADELEDYIKQLTEKNTIEVISEDDTHLADCDVYNGGECTCR